MTAEALAVRITECRLCAERFALTATHHAPRPVPWFRGTARLLISGQAPGMRVHLSGMPFDDASGVRLRGWLGLTAAQFYDRDRVALVGMGFCFPGYDAKGADLAPPRICAQTWRGQVLAVLPDLQVKVLVGSGAIDWHLGKGRVEDRVRRWREVVGEGFWPLPHPSWRNTGWLKRNAWFEAELVPELRVAVARVLG